MLHCGPVVINVNSGCIIVHQSGSIIAVLQAILCTGCEDIKIKISV